MKHKRPSPTHGRLDEVLNHIGPQRVEKAFRQLKAILAQPLLDWVQLDFGGWNCRERWRALLAQTRSRGSIVFFDYVPPYNQKRYLEISFELWEVDAKFSELSLSGLGVAQHILIRRIVNKATLQWRFYCSRCERTRFDELVLFHGSTTPEFLCRKCPGYLSNWQAWRCCGAHYLIDRIRAEGVDLHGHTIPHPEHEFTDGENEMNAAPLWTLQQFALVAGKPWYALQEQTDAGVERQYTGYRHEMDELATKFGIRPEEFAPIGEEEFFARWTS